LDKGRGGEKTVRNIEENDAPDSIKRSVFLKTKSGRVLERENGKNGAKEFGGFGGFETWWLHLELFVRKQKKNHGRGRMKAGGMGSRAKPVKGPILDKKN